MMRKFWECLRESSRPPKTTMEAAQEHDRERAPEMSPSQRIRADIERREKESRAEAEELLAKLLEVDEAERQSLPSYCPEPIIRAYAAGDFLCWDGKEIPRWLITRIEAHAEIGPYARMGPRCFWYAEEDYSRVTVHTNFGMGYSFPVSRHKVGILADALTKAWKHGVAEQE